MDIQATKGVRDMKETEALPDQYYNIQTAKGVRDIPPAEKAMKNQIVGMLSEIFELYGFQPLETPVLERYETLSAKFAAGEASDALKETFRLRDQGGRELGLRFDLTVPLARYVAMNPTLKMPFKRYEVGRVFRDGPLKLGRYREFWQCDADIVGSSSMLADAECLAVIDAAFRKLGFAFVIRLNSRKLINGVLEEAGITEMKEKAIIALDKLGKVGAEGVRKELLERGFPARQVSRALSLINEKTTLAALSKVQNESARQGVAELGELLNYCRGLGLRTVQFDASLARGLAYYTGTVFEAYLKKSQITSSLAAGGRWDGMIGKFMGAGRGSRSNKGDKSRSDNGDKSINASNNAISASNAYNGFKIVPAVGFSFGLEPIMDALRLDIKRQTKPLAKFLTWTYVIPIGIEKEALQVARQLRESGIRTSFALGKKGVSRNLEYANALSIPYVVIIGEDELKKNKVLLRDMNDGTEQLLSVKEVVLKLKKVQQEGGI